ncbi:MAG: spore germination protein GerW family protein [Leifsonia sp.]
MTNLVAQLADSAKDFGVQAAYGDPIEVNGTTIIPVALVWYGFGGGSIDEATGDSKVATMKGIGSGGGGGGYSIPIGAYISRGSRTQFEPNTIALLTVGIPFVATVGWALRRIIRVLKH